MTNDAPPRISIEIWSDVVCPWCYIGKRRFERALDEVLPELDASGVVFDYAYRAYQLDPTAPPGVATSAIDAYAKKFGGYERAQQIIDHVTRTAAADGIEFRMDRALRANTLLAHRLIWRAGLPDSTVAQPVMKERLLKAYFTDGLNIGDPDVLTDCAVEAGAERDDTVAFLATDAGTDEVRAQFDDAHAEGVTAVPTYLFDRRWGVPGAQEPETFVTVIRKMVDRALTEA